MKFMLKHKTDKTFSADKTAEISNWCRKFCPPKNFVRLKILSAEILTDKLVESSEISESKKKV